jgi:hypothetical protein
MEYLGPIPIPEPTPSGVWPLPVDYGLVRLIEPRVVVHQFGTADAKREQRFYLGDGQRRIRLELAALGTARKQAIGDFWEARRGPYEPFALEVREPDGSLTTYTVRFAGDTVSLEQVLEHFWRGSIELIEQPSTTPTYTTSSTVTRFPDTALEQALLAPVQELIPLLVLRTLDPAYTIPLSDRRVQIDGTLYQPRLVDWDGIAQETTGAADTASFTLGNADRVLSALANAVDLDRATVEFSLFHAGTRTRIDLWKGFLTAWSFDAGAELVIEASDGLYELNCAYPTRLITRQDGFTVPDQPVHVGGKKGMPRITATSVVNETAYGQPLADIYCDVSEDKPLVIPCELIAGRDESEFYTALGVIGRGPIGGFGYQWAGGRRVYGLLDEQPNHGGKSAAEELYGIRRSRGSNPVQDFDPDSGSYSFSLDELGRPLPVTNLHGVAFQQVRIVDEKGIQPRAVSGHVMKAFIARGLGGWVWTAPGTRAWQEVITNPIWVAVNVLLAGLGLADVSLADQEAVLDIPACVAAAAVCDEQVPAIIGTGAEKQFVFTGILREQKPLRDWIAEVLANCLGGYTFACGRFRPFVRFHSGAAEAFQEGNVIKGSLALTSIRAAFNKLVATFADQDYGYQSHSVQLIDADHTSRIGHELASQINLVGTATKSQAARIVTARLREELGGLTAEERRAARQIRFLTTVLSLNVEPGMVCSLWHEDMPGGAGEFRVTGWRLLKDYSIEITGQTTTDSMYDLLVGDKPQDVVPDIEIAPTEPYVAYVTSPAATLRDEIVDGVHRVHIEASYRTPAEIGDKDLRFAGVELYLETAAGVKPLGWYLWEGTNPDELVSFTVPNLDPPGAGETWYLYFVSRSLSRKNPLHRRADPPHPKETPYATIAPRTNPFETAPDVRAFTAGNYDEATGVWSPVLEFDASAEFLLIDWACMVPAEIWLANWSGVQIWIQRPDGSGGYTYHQATGKIGLDAFRPPGPQGVHYDQIRIERKHVPASPETWTLIACSYDRNGVPNLSAQGVPRGPTAPITTVLPPASPFEPVADVTSVALAQNPYYTLDAQGTEMVGIGLRVTPPNDPNWLRAALFLDPGTGQLEPVAEYPYSGTVPAPYELETVWRPRPDTDQTWRFVVASVGKNGVRNLPDRTKAGTYLDVAITKVEGIGYPTITGGTVQGDLWEGKQTGAVKITLNYTAPASGQFTGVTLFLKKPSDAAFRSISFHPHAGGPDGHGDSVITYQDRPAVNQDWEIILSPRTAWHGEALFRASDDRNYRLVSIPAIGAASATGITNATVGNITYGKTQDGTAYWGIDHVTWTNPTNDVNFYFSRLTVQKVNAAGQPAPDAEGVERVVYEQQWAGYQNDLTISYWTVPKASDSYRRFRFRLYAVNWKREATLQTQAWSGQSYKDVEPAEQDGGIRADKIDPVTLDPELVIAANKLKIAAQGITTQHLADLAVTAAKIAAGGVDSTKLADAAVTTAKLASLAVDTSKLADLAVAAAKLADSAVTATKIANAAVGSAAIANAAIGTAHIANGAIQSAHIANAQIQSAHIANAAVGAAAIAAAAIGTAHIADLAVTDAKINSLAANKITAGTLAANVVYAGTIHASQVNAGTFHGHSIVLNKNGITTTLDNFYEGAFLVGIQVKDNSSGLNTQVRAGGIWLYNGAGSYVGGFNVNYLGQGSLWVNGPVDADGGFRVGNQEVISGARAGKFNLLQVGGLTVVDGSQNAYLSSLTIGGATKIGPGGDLRPRYFSSSSRPTLEDGELAHWWDGSTFWLLSRVGSNYFKVQMQSA